MNVFLIILIQALKLIRLAVDKLSDIVYGWWLDESESLPPLKSPLLLDPVTYLVAKIAAGKLSSEQVVTAFIQRIKDVNGILNCVVDERFGEAIAEAKQIDQLLKTLSGEKKKQLFQQQPFLGVPFMTKDCFAFTGLSWTSW